jgi:hypothetical protein
MGISRARPCWQSAPSAVFGLPLCHPSMSERRQSNSMAAPRSGYIVCLNEIVSMFQTKRPVLTHQWFTGVPRLKLSILSTVMKGPLRQWVLKFTDLQIYNQIYWVYDRHLVVPALNFSLIRLNHPNLNLVQLWVPSHGFEPPKVWTDHRTDMFSV